MPRAYVMIDVEAGRDLEIQQAVRNLTGVKMVHGVTGGPDLIAFIDADPYEEFAVLLSGIRTIPGVRDTNSCLVLGD